MTVGEAEETAAKAAGARSAAPVTVDLELCKVCGICIALCPESVFDADKTGSPVVARPDDCTQCLICELHCPDFAIAVERRAKKRPAEPAEGSPAADDAADDHDEVPAVDPGALAASGDSCGDHGEED